MKLKICLASFAAFLFSVATPGYSIDISFNPDRTGVYIHANDGYGTWFLNFPERMIIDGEPSGLVSLSKAHKKNNEYIREGTYAYKDYLCHIKIIYTPKKDHIDMDLEVENRSKRAWSFGGEAMACLKPVAAPTFKTELLTLTSVYFGDRLQTVQEIISETRTQAGNEILTFPVKGTPMAPQMKQIHPNYPELDNGTIVRQSADKSHFVGFGWDNVHRVSMNTNRDYCCLHSNPHVPALRPGERAHVKGRISFQPEQKNPVKSRHSPFQPVSVASKSQ